MAVTGGEFFGGEQMAYAAGAPRSNGTGEVLLFSKSFKTSNQPDHGILEPRLVLTGEQIGSSFGYELTTVDVNGDKKPDLVVGAPFYFDKEGGGAVYIYVNSGQYCLNCQPPVRLTGKTLESRFGIAIANLGDLNKDGYEDIAVGAPYQGNGVVYIYLGSKNGITTEPSQIIESESIPTPSGEFLRTWGSSLSSGVDMDNNGYPDLLVGAYESGGAVLLRARPIIQLATSLDPEFNLRNIDPSKQGCPVDPTAEQSCFTFQTCVNIESLNASSNSRRNGKLILRYKLEAETFVPTQKFSRIYFGPDKAAKWNIVEEKIELKSGESRHCRLQTAYVKENTKDIQSPIKMKLSYSLVQQEPSRIKPGSPLQSIDEFPILDQTAAARVFHATFHKDCGSNDECESELHVKAQLQLEERKHDISSLKSLTLCWYPFQDCLLGTARCFKITCDVYNLYANHEATITIRARLFNSTLVEDYPHVDRVIIASRAKIDIPLSLFLHQKNLTDDETQVKTVAMKDLVQQSRPVWHIILLAILLGLLLLILLILCLRRLGFFRRHRHPPPDPTLSGNLRTTYEDEDDD
ncbi:integrin alpha-PS1 [Diaphorina citri]|uniref:Integrin alpha-PS1 n=1 Tax=Diaphorina citri TaxID=121845 RepID=A0A3Q0IQX6_DIACI|nr:integrin alpha-PS1 [Diaphorina citri]